MDKFQFAYLVSWLTRREPGMFDKYELEELDRIVATIAPATVDYANEIRDMLSAMAEGRKIDAIRTCRTLVGVGLKEAKDMIEAAARI